MKTTYISQGKKWLYQSFLINEQFLDSIGHASIFLILRVVASWAVVTSLLFYGASIESLDFKGECETQLNKN